MALVGDNPVELLSGGAGVDLGMGGPGVAGHVRHARAQQIPPIEVVATDDKIEADATRIDGIGRASLRCPASVATGAHCRDS
ncbi:MAG: hypothetical protein ACYCXA_01310 [Actinomycetes bacterium]